MRVTTLGGVIATCQSSWRSHPGVLEAVTGHERRSSLAAPARQQAVSDSGPPVMRRCSLRGRGAGQAAGAPRRWTLQRHTHQRVPAPVARGGLHADATSGAVALCDPRHSVRLLAFEPLNPLQPPFQVDNTPACSSAPSHAWHGR